MKKVINMFIGVTLASLGIACVLNSDLGCFGITATYKAMVNWFNIPLALANIIVECTMIAYATYKGEGLGWTAIINATYGAIMLSIFHDILPHTTIIWLGGFLIPIGWSRMGKAGMGDSGSNILQRALMKQTGKSLCTIRLIIEGTFLILGYIGARQYVTWFTVFLTLITGPVLQSVYKLIGYKPTVVDHKFIIGNKVKSKGGN